MCDCIWNISRKMCNSFWKILRKTCFWKLCQLKKCFEVKRIKIKTMFMYFWLNYCDENHVERIPIAVKIINHLFHLASEIMDADTLNLFLFFDGTRIDENEHLSSLESGTELIVCTEEQIPKLLIYFELKRCLSLKNISYPLNIIFYDAWLLSGKLLF